MKAGIYRHTPLSLCTLVVCAGAVAFGCGRSGFDPALEDDGAPFAAADADRFSPDADPTAPDADPNAPDADPNAPDADPSAPDASNDTNVLVRQIQISDDDTEETLSTGNVDPLSLDLDLGFNQAKPMMNATRFTTIDIPAGAAIVSASIQFTAEGIESDVATLSISAEDVDDAPILTSTKFSISSKTKTTASVPWSPPAWPTIGESGPNQKTPNLAVIVTEVLSRPGWSSGNSLTFLFSGSGHRPVHSFDGEPASAAILRIEYTP